MVAAFLSSIAPNPITEVGTSPAPIDTGVPNLILVSFEACCVTKPPIESDFLITGNLLIDALDNLKSLKIFSLLLILIALPGATTVSV